MQVAIAVALGGAFGSVVRYALSAWVAQATRLNGSGTLVVNVTGAFGLGLLLGLIESRFPSMPRPMAVGIGAGVFGGFTTFSSFMWDVVEHAEAGRWPVAFAILITSVVLGLGAMVAGLAVGRTA